jgi:hypothetical protein
MPGRNLYAYACSSLQSKEFHRSKPACTARPQPPITTMHGNQMSSPPPVAAAPTPAHYRCVCIQWRAVSPGTWMLRLQQRRARGQRAHLAAICCYWAALNTVRGAAALHTQCATLCSALHHRQQEWPTQWFCGIFEQQQHVCHSCMHPIAMADSTPQDTCMALGASLVVQCAALVQQYACVQQCVAVACVCH